eukprot:scaffold34916_cov170-Amphora_coffeaeformis.AAC.1
MANLQLIWKQKEYPFHTSIISNITIRYAMKVQKGSCSFDLLEMRIEFMTLGLLDPRSNQLSYTSLRDPFVPSHTHVGLTRLHDESIAVWDSFLAFHRGSPLVKTMVLGTLGQSNGIR